MESYIRRELGAGEVKFIVGNPSGFVAIPAAAALLFIFVVYKVFPWMPAVIVLGAGVFLFYRLRIRLRRRAENLSTFYVASPAGLTIRDRTIPRPDIKEVTWLIGSTPVYVGHPADRPSDCSVHVWTVNESIPLAIQMQAGTAEGFARALGQALGGVPVSGDYSPVRTR